MTELDEAIARLALELHPDRLRAIATGLSKYGNAGAVSVFSVIGAEIPDRHRNRISKLLHQLPCSAAELAASLRATAAVTALIGSSSSSELVWTGPASGLVPVRHTEQVLTGLIDGATRRIFIVCFVAYHVPSVIESLARATARGVEVSMLLEKSEEAGGNVSVDSFSLLRQMVPESKLYEWDHQVSGDAFKGASVHAKCAVADAREAFISSANLSSAAMERNMEAGVLFRGGHLPMQLDAHLFALVATRHLRMIQKNGNL